MKRTDLHRRTPLARVPFKRRSNPIRQRSRKPRDRGERSDPRYLAWLRVCPCRVPGCHNASEAHHLRFDEHGAAIGAHLKDDRRAISLCRQHHVEQLHQAPWVLRRILGVDDLRAWQDEQLDEQRAEYAMQAAAQPERHHPPGLAPLVRSV